MFPEIRGEFIRMFDYNRMFIMFRENLFRWIEHVLTFLTKMKVLVIKLFYNLMTIKSLLTLEVNKYISCICLLLKWYFRGELEVKTWLRKLKSLLNSLIYYVCCKVKVRTKYIDYILFRKYSFFGKILFALM